MNSQKIKARVLAISLFMTSIGGTFAIFGCVPMLARLTSSTAGMTPAQVQAFPEVSERPDSSQPAATASPSDRSQQARAFLFFKSRQIEREQAHPRSAL